MNTLKKTVSVTITSLLGATALSLLAPTSPAFADACGFRGIPNQSTIDRLLGDGDDGKYVNAQYNHCGNGNVMVQVDYVYANEKICVTPGITQLHSNPNLGAVTNAFYIGEGC